MTLRILFVAAVLLSATVSIAQSPDQAPLPVGGSVSSPSDVRGTPQTPDEIRMARAQYRSRQRLARLEHNLWIGYDPLRPQWSSVPMMTSRYAPRRVYYVPVYVGY